jgi:hypothetical protein
VRRKKRPQVLEDEIHLQIHLPARTFSAQGGPVQGVLNQMDPESIPADLPIQRQAYPVHSHRPLGNQEGAENRRHPDFKSDRFSMGRPARHRAAAVHMAQQEVPAEAAAHPKGAFQVHPGPGAQAAQRGGPKGFGQKTENQIGPSEFIDSQANSIHADAFPKLNGVEPFLRTDRQPPAFPRENPAHGLHDPGKHLGS